MALYYMQLVLTSGFVIRIQKCDHSDQSSNTAILLENPFLFWGFTKSNLRFLLDFNPLNPDINVQNLTVFYTVPIVLVGRNCRNKTFIFGDHFPYSPETTCYC